MQIGTTLTRQGRRTARGLRSTKVRVRVLRQPHGIAVYQSGEQDSGAPLPGLASSTLCRWIDEGFIAVEEPLSGAASLAGAR